MRRGLAAVAIVLAFSTACTPTEFQTWRSDNGLGSVSEEDAAAWARFLTDWTNERDHGGEIRIRGVALATVDDARAWARANDARPGFRIRADRYWAIAAEREIRADVLYALSAKETAFGRHPGVVPVTHFNPCGLKVSAGGADDDPDAHQRFDTWDEGIAACADHLALYAGAPGYPRAGSPDPRHFAFLFETAVTVEDLGGRWSPQDDYGTSVRHDYLEPMVAR